MSALFELITGRIPLLVSFPHSGTYLPRDIAERMTDLAHTLPDTDWHVPVLYKFLNELGASRIVATHSRYVVDLNRPPDSTALYPGQKNTGLVPSETFASQPLYKDSNDVPSDREIGERRERFYRPYHDALHAELDRISAMHGYALLWDAHSIRSEVPELFEGRLPDLNIGTNSGASTPPKIGAALLTAGQRTGFSCVLNGRFKGGYITRYYGRTDSNVLAVQLEMAQAIYMDEEVPYAYNDALAPNVQVAIRKLVETYIEAGGKHFKR